MQASGIFITGTDTGVGKTYIGSELCRILYTRGIPVQPRKPVESGCTPDSQGLLIPEDANRYFAACNGSIPLQTICPWRFETAVAPDYAARLDGVNLKLQQLENSCQVKTEEFLLVEGAGGFYSPIATDGLNADLAKSLNLPVLLVASDRLGTINQVLLTANAIKQQGLKLAAVILNSLSAPETPLNNRESLADRMDCLIVEVSRNNMPDADALASLALP